MLVYWGGCTGAKRFVKRLLIYNSRDYVEHYPFNIVHAKHICHSAPKPLLFDSKWDVSRNTDIISSDGTKTTGWEREEDYVSLLSQTMYGMSSRIFGGITIEPSNFWGHRKKVEGLSNNSSAGLGDKFCHPRKYNIRKNPKDLVELTVNDIPECHTIFPYHLSAESSFDNVEISDWFSSHTNIVPYKSDLIESTINQLDNWGEHYDVPWWKANKEKIWKHLDLTVFEMWYRVERRLRKFGIKYEYFDLDKDDWAKTFQLERSLPRQIMHHIYCQMNYLPKEKKKKAYENHRRMTEIAKEYVAQCGRKDNRLWI